MTHQSKAPDPNNSLNTMSNKKILYHCPPARSIRNAWLIHELREQGLAKDIEIKKIDFQKGEHKQPEFKKLNPHGKLPVYVDGDKVILESGAILIHLAQKYKKFIPKDTAKFYMWIIYAVATGIFLILSIYQNSGCKS